VYGPTIAAILSGILEHKERLDKKYTSAPSDDAMACDDIIMATAVELSESLTLKGVQSEHLNEWRCETCTYINTVGKC